MNENEKQKDMSVDFAAYTEFATGCFNENPTGSRHLDILHCCTGLAGESGELIEIAKKHVFHNKPLDRVDVVSETGDLLWYLANLMKLFDVSLTEAIEANKIKLKSRYPNGRDKNFMNNNRNHELESSLIKEKLENNT